MLGTSEVGRSLLLVFSDGVDTASWLTAGAVIDTARRADVVTYAVVAGDKLKQSFLRDLVTSQGSDGRSVEAQGSFTRSLSRAIGSGM